MYTNLVLLSCRPESRVYKEKIKRNFAFISNLRAFSARIELQTIFEFGPVLVRPLTTLHH